MIQDPVLGISLTDGSTILETPPSVLLYGPPGSGKTTTGAKAFPGALWLTTSPTGLRSFASYMRDNPADVKQYNLRLPAYKYIPRYAADGKTRLPVLPVLREIIYRYCESCVKGTCPYTGIAFDEYSEFLASVYEDIRADSSIGGNNAFAKIDALKTFDSWIMELPRITGRSQLLIAHDLPPKYDEDENSPTFKKLLAKGGPATPIANERTKLAAGADVCVRVELRQVGLNVKRTIMAQANPLWETKFRDVKIKDEEELDLLKMLTTAGYKL